MDIKAKPTDDEILAAVASRHNLMTYVVRNILAMENAKYREVKTDFIRRRLFAMEKLGKVKQVKSPYLVQTCWAVAQ